MADTWWIIITVLSGLLIIVSTWALIIGLTTMIDGSELQRCPHCGHFGVDRHQHLHANGCPAPHHLFSSHRGHFPLRHH